MDEPEKHSDFDPRTITRPDPALFSYYLVISLLTTVGFPIIFLPLLFKYRTLKYRFDDDGVAMSWGLLFRKEIYLTHRRIQDIHVTRNLLQRWLGLATISVQTASGTAGAEMTIEGIRESDLLRDHLYARMRGATEADNPPTADKGEASEDTVTELLREIRDALHDLARNRSEPA